MSALFQRSVPVFFTRFANSERKRKATAPKGQAMREGMDRHVTYLRLELRHGNHEP